MGNLFILERGQNYGWNCFVKWKWLCDSLCKIEPCWDSYKQLRVKHTTQCSREWTAQMLKRGFRGCWWFWLNYSRIVMKLSRYNERERKRERTQLSLKRVSLKNRLLRKRHIMSNNQFSLSLILTFTTLHCSLVAFCAFFSSGFMIFGHFDAIKLVFLFYQQSQSPYSSLISSFSLRVTLGF